MTGATATSRKPRAHLMRILRLGFGVAIVFGCTVGVGILRLHGTVAAQLGNSWLVLAVWIGGGIYALLGAVSVAGWSCRWRNSPRPSCPRPMRRRSSSPPRHAATSQAGSESAWFVLAVALDLDVVHILRVFAVVTAVVLLLRNHASTCRVGALFFACHFISSL